jgi:hypothetical protein
MLLSIRRMEPALSIGGRLAGATPAEYFVSSALSARVAAAALCYKDV